MAKVKQINFNKVKIKEFPPKAKVESILPFRIRLTSINIPAYSANNPAPVGVAIIGGNNWIL